MRTRSLTLVAVVAFASACRCPDADLLHVEDFEDCTGACGFDVLAGTIARVETIHPAEHALELSTSATIESVLELDPRQVGTVAWVTDGVPYGELRPEADRTLFVITNDCAAPGELRHTEIDLGEGEGASECDEPGACPKPFVVRVENRASTCTIDELHVLAPEPYCR